MGKIFDIKEFKNDRYAIYKAGTDNIILNANRYGYKSKIKAKNTIYWFLYLRNKNI